MHRPSPARRRNANFDDRCHLKASCRSRIDPRSWNSTPGCSPDADKRTVPPTQKTVKHHFDLSRPCGGFRCAVDPMARSSPAHPDHQDPRESGTPHPAICPGRSGGTDRCRTESTKAGSNFRQAGERAFYKSDTSWRMPQGRLRCRVIYLSADLPALAEALSLPEEDLLSPDEALESLPPPASFLAASL